MDLTGLTVWRCPEGHVLGQVKRNGKKVQRLLLYREAISYQQSADSSIQEVDVMAVVEGLVMDVRCSICGGIRTWRPGTRVNVPGLKPGVREDEERMMR